MGSHVNDTFMFLTKLAWKNRLTLPILITIAFMACNFRWEVEISIQTERVAFQQENNGNINGNDDNSDDLTDGTWEQNEYEIDSDTDIDDDDDDEEDNESIANQRIDF